MITEMLVKGVVKSIVKTAGATKGIKLTYDLLRNSSYKELIKMGFNEEQIFKKLNKFYLKEGRQLTGVIKQMGRTERYVIDVNKLSKAIANLNKGRVQMGNLIADTARSSAKKQIRFLENVVKTTKNEAAEKILNSFYAGEKNYYMLDKSIHHYLNSLAEYVENKTDIEQIQGLVKGYNIY